MTNEQTFPIGKYIKLFLSNGFKYEGVIENSTEGILIINDSRINESRSIVISHIVDFQLSQSKLKIESGTLKNGLSGPTSHDAKKGGPQ